MIAGDKRFGTEQHAEAGVRRYDSSNYEFMKGKCMGVMLTC